MNKECMRIIAIQILHLKSQRPISNPYEKIAVNVWEYVSKYSINRVTNKHQNHIKITITTQPHNKQTYLQYMFTCWSTKAHKNTHILNTHIYTALTSLVTTLVSSGPNIYTVWTWITFPIRLFTFANSVIHISFPTKYWHYILLA